MLGGKEEEEEGGRLSGVGLDVGDRAWSARSRQSRFSRRPPGKTG